nr:hypothetical protein [Streptomyces boncukensis]
MTGAATAAVVAGLLLSGCGSSDDGGDGSKDAKDAKDKSSATPSTPEAPGKEKDAADDAAGGKATLSGFWQTRAGGDTMVLTIVDDAASLRRDGKMCTGRVLGTGDTKSLTLKCPGGTGEERTNGQVGALTAKTLKVSWNGGATDRYVKAAEAPSKLPKAPEELPDLREGLKKITEGQE